MSWKPSMKPLNSIDEVPLPAVLVAKADGEFEVIHFDGYLCRCENRYGLIRYSLPALKEMTRALRRIPIESATLLGELYGVVDGKPQDLRYFLSHKDDQDLHIGVFDLPRINGRKVREKYHKRIKRVYGWLRECKHAHALPFTLAETVDEARDFWREQVERRGYEGVVAHSGGDIYKIKPIQEIDAVIIAVNKRRRLRHGEVTSLKVAVMDHGGRFIELCDVASGIDHELRKTLMGLLEFKTGETDEAIYVKPIFVVQIKYQEAYLGKRRAWSYQNGRYRPFDTVTYYSLRHPVLMRFRPDKKPTPRDVGAGQIPPPIE